MKIRMRRGSLAAIAVAVTSTLALSTACSTNDDDKGGGTSGGKVKLVVDTFGGGKNFGYEALLKQYQQSHPNITIEHRNTERFDDQYLPALLQRLEAGSGAGDVVAIDEGGMGLMKARPQYFADLGQQGLESRKSEFPSWKWDVGVNSDGKLFALGTDVGGLTMCYRRDLFKKAGLPTERDEVSKLWPDWNAFIETGKKFQGKVSDTKFIDGPNTLFNTVMVQEAAKNGNVAYFDKSNQLVAGSNPAVKSAFDFVQTFSKAGLSAKLQNFTPTWDTGFKKSQFATLACPAWMLGVVSEKAGPSLEGEWDVAAVPGGAGNWGGSWLAVPKQSKHPKEAAELLNFLTGKEGHVGAFKEASTFPSSLPAQQDPAVSGLKNPYFNNAPVGEIFSKSVATLQPVFLGEKHSAVKTEVEKVVQGMDQGSIGYDEAWKKLVEAAEKAAR